MIQDLLRELFVLEDLADIIRDDELVIGLVVADGIRLVTLLVFEQADDLVLEPSLVFCFDQQHIFELEFARGGLSVLRNSRILPVERSAPRTRRWCGRALFLRGGVPSYFK